MADEERTVTVNFIPQGGTFQVRAGQTIAAAARQGGWTMETPCGGEGTCGKCLVRVQAGSVSPPNAMELRTLPASRLQAGYRLACQTTIEGESVLVEVPPETQSRLARVLEAGFSTSYPLKPEVRSAELRLEEPAGEGSGGDWERVAEALNAALRRELQPEVKMLRELPGLLRDLGRQVEGVVVGNSLAALRPLPQRPLGGVAVDIGTTTVVAYLLDLRDGNLLATESMVNPQVAFGAEVISRVTYALEHTEGRREMRQVIVKGLNGLLERLCLRAHFRQEDLFEVSIVGNTTMHHLFLGIDPSYLVRSPYVAAVTSPLSLSALEAGLQINPCGRVYLLPCIGAFLGADTVGVVLATGFQKGKGPGLVLDLGTNGEMVARLDDELLACSTAAGPAFEGVEISCGMRAAPGAIEHLRSEGSYLELEVITGAKPMGICGSGLLDAVAFLLNEGYLEARGRLLSSLEVTGREAGQGWPSLERTAEGNLRLDKAAPLVAIGEDGPEFRLIPPELSGAGRGISITQKDIRQLQLAKGAIRAGTRILAQVLGLHDGVWEEVLLAGAFGSFVSRESCLRLGLLPPVDEALIKPVGNAAGSGARLALLSLPARREAVKIARRIRPLNLAKHPDFQQEFFQGMLFEEGASWTE